MTQQVLSILKKAVWPYGVALLLLAGGMAGMFWLGEHHKPTPAPPPAPITMPAKIVSSAGWAKVTATAGGKVMFQVPAALKVIERYPAAVIVGVDPHQPGTWTVQGFVVQGGELYGAQTSVTLGAPPGPGPTPPAPIPVTGFRVLMIYDQNATASLTPGQGDVLFGKQVKDYLQTKCAQAAGKAEWRVWPGSQDASGESTIWQEAFKRKRASLPWIVVSNGSSGFEGPLPPSVPEAMTLLEKYGG